MDGPWRVGLTGGIASGKTTVAQRFVELGVPVIDADLAARRVVERDSPGLTRIVDRFGRGVLQPDGVLDRGILRGLIFSNPTARRDLEAILHPLIRADMEAEACALRTPYLVMAIPLLIEGGAARQRVDRVLVVDTPESVQIARLRERDGGSEGQARAILASQASRTARLAAADDVIQNSGTVSALRGEVDRLHADYLVRALQGGRQSN